MIAIFRRLALTACCLLNHSGCASLPNAAREIETAHPQAAQFDGARGPVSASKSAGILDELKRKSGDIDILQKHLATEQAINADSPLVLLQDGPANAHENYF